MIRAIGEQAAYELGHHRSWPLDEDWESYRPPAGWDEPLVLPDLPSVLEARARGRGWRPADVSRPATRLRRPRHEHD